MPAPFPQSHPAASTFGGISRSTRVIAASALVAMSGLGLLGSFIRTQSTALVPVGSARLVGERIDPNTADAARLTLLPRIGPVLAGRIVADREEHGSFQDAADMQRVKGIGPKTVERIGPMLVFEAEAPSQD